MKDRQEKHLAKRDMQEAELTRDGQVFVPATDIYENEDSILVRCDMPDVTQAQLDIRLDNTELEISAAQLGTVPEGYDLLSGEYRTGVFQRRFNIPQLIDREKIHARLHSGVLEIVLPKAEQARPRKIEITAGG
jgi:HSP20 family molecular chaperone IbpA